MNSKEVLDLTAKLISIRSLSGNEMEATDFLAKLFTKFGWQFELQPVESGRCNLFVSWGVPEVVFTTHVDIVPAPDSLFTPRFAGETLYGRGACDAKGIAVTMISVVKTLVERGASNLGLLLVVGEEFDGIGAQAAAKRLQGRGIRYIINGEPTEGKLMSAHKGGLGVQLTLLGTSAHSGYPELGVDANRAMIELASRLINTDFGSNSALGATTLNLGVIQGGVAGNVVSSKSEMTALFRTTSKNSLVLEKLRPMLPANCSMEVNYDVDPVSLLTVPGFETDVAKYCTDIPFFEPLKAKALLYGPGSIHRAHTDHEFITASEVSAALDGYHRLFDALTNQAL